MRLLAIGVASLVMASQSGCGRVLWPLPPPPSEELRSTLGRVAVRTDEDAFAESVLRPSISGACGSSGYGVVMGLAFGIGAAGAMLGGLRGVGGGGGGAGAIIVAVVVFFVVCIAAILVALGLVGGTLWGLANTPSGKAIEEARRKIEASIRDCGLSGRIGRRIVERAARDVDVPVAAWSPGASADTILEISGPCVTLKGPWKFDAPLRLRSEMRVRLVSARDGSVLHAFSLGNVGRERTFEQWAEVKGSAMVEELGDPGRFAERILDEVFLLTVLPPAEPPSASRTRP